MNPTFFMRNAEKNLPYNLLSAVTEIANCNNIAVSTKTSLCQSFATYVPYFDKTIKQRLLSERDKVPTSSNKESNTIQFEVSLQKR